MLEQRSIRHQLGRVGRGGDLPEDRAILHSRSEAVPQAASGESTRAEETGGHDV